MCIRDRSISPFSAIRSSRRFFTSALFLCKACSCSLIFFRCLLYTSLHCTLTYILAGQVGYKFCNPVERNTLHYIKVCHQCTEVAVSYTHLIYAMPTIMDICLVKVPDYAVLFTQCMLACNVICLLYTSSKCSIHAYVMS